MPELAADCAAQKQIQKMALAENGFQVAPENVEPEHVSQEMPRAAIKQRRSDELPRVSIMDTAIA